MQKSYSLPCCLKHIKSYCYAKKLSIIVVLGLVAASYNVKENRIQYSVPVQVSVTGFGIS